MTNSMHSALLDVEGAAEFLCTSVRHIRRLVAQRRVPYYKVGHFIRFKPDELQTWVEEYRVEAVSYDRAA